MNDQSTIMNASNPTPEPRLRQLFLAALDITDPAKRERFVADACGQDRGLHQQLHQLLAHHKADSFMERPAARVDDSSAETVDSSRGGTEVMAGRIQVNMPVTLKYFGDYELLEEIARGGMGVVWKARQKSLNRVVAVKMILGGQIATEADVKRFHTEAEAAANLKHPNIVAIHEIGEHEGRHYFSMDLIEGKNLAQVIGNEPMPAQKAAAVMKTLAEAVHYAHQRGTLHRDLKPQNVLMGEAGQPHITDFGLAKQMSAGSELTQSGTVMGSPSYMPPEQATGRLAEIGPASDVYSLGAILYQMLTGKVPFAGATPVDTLRQVVEQEVTRPSKLNEKVPADLETICLKCLEKKPEQRYASARALAEELGRFLNHEPILAKPATTARKLVSWCRQRPWAVTGVMTLGLLLLAGLAFGLWEHNRLLRWQAEHPGQKPGARWFGVESELRGSLAALQYLVLLPAALFQYFNLWHRRLKGVPMSAAYLRWVAFLGACCGLLALLALMAELSNVIWWQRKFSNELWLTLGVFLPLCWLGVLLIWEAIRGRDTYWFVGSPDDLNPAKQLSIDGPAWLLALPLLNVLLYGMGTLLVWAGEFQPASSFLANGHYVGSPELDANYREGLRKLFVLTGVFGMILFSAMGLWRHTRPPWRDLGAVGASLFITMLPLLANQMPRVLFWPAIAAGLLGGWLMWRLAPLRPVEQDKQEMKAAYDSLMEQRSYLTLLLLVVALAIAAAVGIRELIPSRMQGGLAILLIVVVAHWPLARVMWQHGKARGRLIVLGSSVYTGGGVLSNQPFGSFSQFCLALVLGAALGLIFERAIRRRRCS